ncbi:hypothetical protein G4G28_11180 [Massilia sp. Dwa41.01b]|uniref:hypothetical protein n=1 Tax=unclassified Massilia TaxID=2609279 RepID=UPI001601307D|nr:MULTISPECIES: hypothetical protein [unclassified Massilia]QNA88910.1 hypothetical protein G4G28_11180 [Massilia sp. Dwa41.01b]QNA99801.1 hypothetical protein G4G31_14810 [Massilia sp. Se16.2.3]
MKRWRTVFTVTILAAMATLASSSVGAVVLAIYPDIMGCEAGCPTVAGGWPAPYLIDYPAISPVGSVALTEALLGDDKIWPRELALSFAFWLAASAVALWIGRRLAAASRSAPGS